MRAAIIAIAGLAALSMAACNKDSAADDHLKAAGNEAKAAVSDVGRAIDSSVPAIKAAGAKVGDGIKEAGAKAAPELKKAGNDIKEAGHKAGSELKDAGQKAKDKGSDKG